MGAFAGVDDSALLGVLAAFRTLDREQKKRVQAAFRGTAVPLFRKAYTQRARTPQQRKAAGIGLVSLSAGGKGTMKGYSTSSKTLSGGLDASGGDWPFIEFGSGKDHGRRGQLPPWQRSGRIFFGAVDATAKTVQRVYLGVTYDLLREIADG